MQTENAEVGTALILMRQDERHTKSRQRTWAKSTLKICCHGFARYPPFLPQRVSPGSYKLFWGQKSSLRHLHGKEFGLLAV